MRRYLILLSMLLTVVLSSCHRDHLYYRLDETLKVAVHIDWSKTGIHPNGASVMAYCQDGSLYKAFPPMNNPSEGIIELPMGVYRLLVFNDTPIEYEGNMTFDDPERLSAYLVQGAENKEAMSRLKALGEIVDLSAMPLLQQPDSLAVGLSEAFEITEDMIVYKYDKPSALLQEVTKDVYVTPEHALSFVSIRAHVKGLSQTQGMTMSVLTGLSDGRYLADNKETVDDPAMQAFILNHRTFDDGSLTDGVIKADFPIYGICTNEGMRYILGVNFVLGSGKYYPLALDVTDQILSGPQVDEEGRRTYLINLEIEIPTQGQVIRPGGEEDSNDTDVIPWVDEVYNIDINENEY